VAPKTRPLDLSIFGGIHAGATLVGGSVGEPVGPAGTFGFEAGARFLSHFYGTALFDLALFSSGAASQKSVSSWLVGVRGGYLSNPEGFGFAADLGVAYRGISLADATGTSLRRGGADALVGAGLHFKIGDTVRLFLPRVDLSAGSTGAFTHYLVTFGVVAMYNHDVGRRHRHED
jgi:hypothetical protein